MVKRGPHSGEGYMHPQVPCLALDHLTHERELIDTDYAASTRPPILAGHDPTAPRRLIKYLPSP
jgi:hypothetical protein